jgi:metal-responsive CopG/Arc/MetJ family transcriptional regulator
MGYAKISITIPEEIFKEVKEIVKQRKIKLSHLISNNLADEVRKFKEEEFVRRINEMFKDPEIAQEQRHMANDIDDNMDVEELPW